MLNDILLKDGGTSYKDYVASLLACLQTITNEFAVLYPYYGMAAHWNAQKMVLQAALNEIFGVTTAPFILVETAQGTSGASTFFYEPSELSPTFFSEPSENDPVFFFESPEIPAAGGDTDFRVKIPIAIYTAELDRRVAAVVTKLKVAGTSFSIVTY